MIYKITNSFKDYLEYTNLLSQLASNFEQPSFENFENYLDHLDSHTHIFLLEQNKNIVGTLKIIIEPKFYTSTSCVAHIEDVVIDKDFRSKGYGKELMNFANTFCQEKGCYKSILYCSIHNVPFYEKNGFMVEGANLVRRFK